MRPLIIYLIISLFLSACVGQLTPIRRSVEGYVFDSKTKQPIDSVSVYYLMHYKVGRTQMEDTIYTNKKGFFKLSEIRWRIDYRGGKRFQRNLAKYIEFSKKGYVTDTINSLIRQHIPY